MTVMGGISEHLTSKNSKCKAFCSEPVVGGKIIDVAI